MTSVNACKYKQNKNTINITINNYNDYRALLNTTLQYTTQPNKLVRVDRTNVRDEEREREKGECDKSESDVT